MSQIKEESFGGKKEKKKKIIIFSLRIKKYPGELESLLRCEITLSTSGTEKQWVKPPITMEFQVIFYLKLVFKFKKVPMFTASGLRVRFLRVYEKSGYRPTKWIRYITKGGDYQNRL